MLQEVQPDEDSASGVIESWGSKMHAQLIRKEELLGGINCSEDGMRCDAKTRSRILDAVLSNVREVEGDVFEFGVAAGESFLEFLKRCPDRQVYGFDSFEGLPEDWWTRPKGTFSSPPPLFSNPNGHLVKGWFNESVPQFFSAWKGRIAILHIDCDLYSSTMAALEQALEHCGPGTVVLFDEFYNYPGFEQHEWRAWREVRALRSIGASCIAYDGRRAAFVIKSGPKEEVSNGHLSEAACEPNSDGRN
jgi:hypothetical protein